MHLSFIPGPAYAHGHTHAPTRRDSGFLRAATTRCKPFIVWFVWVTVLASIGVLPAAVAADAAATGTGTLVYFGTYTGKQSKGIYVSRLDMATGRLTAAELAAETASPS